MTLAATHPVRSLSSAPKRHLSSETVVNDLGATRTAPPVFRGILFAGLFSLPFWGGIAVVVSLVAR